MNNQKIVNVIGAGFAGSEAAYQLSKRGIKVKLYEMRPKKTTGAHTTGNFAELVCSNSLRAKGLTNAVGILKEEMRLMGSLIMEAALATEVEAGGALAVDRELFSKYITNKLENDPNIEIVRTEVTKIPEGPTIIASGPLTSDALSDAIKNRYTEQNYYFFDAIAPIVDASTIDYDKVFLASRYNKGEAAYLNCPMNKEEFEKFYDYLIHADTVIPADFELKVFDGCMPIEDIAKRGPQTLLYGPMKPVGLDDPKTGRWPYAVVQLRQDNKIKTMYNIVGFQTHLKYPSQDKLLKLIPGLENAKILRYGVMHKNTYLCSPKILKNTYQTVDNDELFFAGQMTGVEGYVESASSGLIAGINMANMLNGLPLLNLDAKTANGALANYITTADVNDFVPMNVNFGIFEAIIDSKVNKKNRKEAYATRALEEINKIIGDENW